MADLDQIRVDGIDYNIQDREARSGLENLKNVDTFTDNKISITESFTTEFPNKWFKSFKDDLEDISLYEIIYANNSFFAIGDSIYSSEDGIKWTKSSNISSNISIGSIAYGGSKFIVTTNTVNHSYYSTDGKNWTAGGTVGPSGTTYIMRDCAYGNSLFVAVGLGGVSYYTSDGINWTAGSKSTSTRLNSIAYGNGRFVAVGDSGVSCYSTDGKTWTNGGSLGTSTAINSVTFGNNRFVAVSNLGEFYYSTNGVSWTNSADISSTLYGVAYGNGKFVAVGINGIILYSVDGISWSEDVNFTKLLNTNNLYGVAYGNGKFVAVGIHNSIVYSEFKKKYTSSITATEDKSVKETISQLYINSKITTKTLKAGYTRIEIPDIRINSNSILSFYTSKYGVDPIEVEVDTNVVTLTFSAQNEDMEVGVSIDG